MKAQHLKPGEVAVYEKHAGRWEIWVDGTGTRYADYYCAHSGFVMPVPDQEPEETDSFCEPEVFAEECRRCPFFPLPDLENPNWLILTHEEAVYRYWDPLEDEDEGEYRNYIEIVYQDTGNKARRDAMLRYGLS